MHAPNNCTYLWAPPPAAADACLEEMLKASHKRHKACHIVMILQLCTPQWHRLFWKQCDLNFFVPVDSLHWPIPMHEPLWVGIKFPFFCHRPWSLKGAPLLIRVKRQLQEVFEGGESDGSDILRLFL